MNSTAKLCCRSFQAAFRLALPVLPYREPKLLHSMDQIAPVLSGRGVRSVLLVTDPTVRRMGLTMELERTLTDSNIICAVYDDVMPNPTVEQVEEARTIYVHQGAQAIIAVGGGSVIDCAKAVGARIARPHKSVNHMKGLLKVMHPTPLTVAVPTTAGTGSETTLAAVITDPKTHLKYPINDFALIPDFAVLDPAMTVQLPPMVTATTGMDALTHAVEAYIGGTTTKFTRSMAERAVELIANNLRRAYENGSDLEARRSMLLAAYYAGAAFSRSYVGYVHAVAHSLGGQYGVPHGLANAVILPYFLERYGTRIHKQLATLARVAGLADTGMDDSRAAGLFVDWVRQMNAHMNIPTVIPEIQAQDIPELARRASREANPLYPVPVLMDASELEEMYHKLMPQEDTKWTSVPQSKPNTHFSVPAGHLA